MKIKLGCGIGDTPVDDELLRAWVTGRSLARGVPPPVLDRGGLRVDTGSVDEVCRWTFHRIGPGLLEVARTIDQPGYLLKACAPSEAMQTVLPSLWQVRHTGWFMTAAAPWGDAALPTGYAAAVDRAAAVTRVQVRTPDGDVAASGFAAETADAFVYDRIVTAPDHRRRGLGRAVMTILRRASRDPSIPGLLVATDAGRALYEKLEWRSLSPYSTASIVAA